MKHVHYTRYQLCRLCAMGHVCIDLKAPQKHPEVKHKKEHTQLPHSGLQGHTQLLTDFG